MNTYSWENDFVLEEVDELQVPKGGSYYLDIVIGGNLGDLYIDSAESNCQNKNELVLSGVTLKTSLFIPDADDLESVIMGIINDSIDSIGMETFRGKSYG